MVYLKIGSCAIIIDDIQTNETNDFKLFLFLMMTNTNYQ